jgi:hypothetical protein
MRGRPSPPSLGTRQISDELDHLGRVPVDRQLRALADVFVAGDTAAAAFDAEHTVMRCRIGPAAFVEGVRGGTAARHPKEGISS